MKHVLLLAISLLALAGCGSREPLKPAIGATMPVIPGTATPATADALLTRTPEQQPERKDELLKRSQERPDDRFNLPPPG